jgi:hypothetical protein
MRRQMMRAPAFSGLPAPHVQLYVPPPIYAPPLHTPPLYAPPLW